MESHQQFSFAAAPSDHMHRLPNFFIIGAMKAATSSLHDQLAAIDGVFMSDPKELYFFSDDPVYSQGLDWYAEHFREAGETDIIGESTTHYAKLPTYPKTIERLADAIDGPRFVYVMRHPLDRLVSQYTHMWLEREVTVSFDEAIEGAVPELIDYSRYSYQLEPYFDRFGADRVLPVFFDRLRSHGTAELNRVSSFIGVDTATEWNDTIGAKNVSAERLQQSNVRNGMKKVPGYEMLRGLLPETAVEKVRDRWRPSGRPTLSRSQEAAVAEILDADLARLGSWLGINLTVATFATATAELAAPAWQANVLTEYPGAR